MQGFTNAPRVLRAASTPTWTSYRKFARQIEARTSRTCPRRRRSRPASSSTSAPTRARHCQACSARPPHPKATPAVRDEAREQLAAVELELGQIAACAARRSKRSSRRRRIPSARSAPRSSWRSFRCTKTSRPRPSSCSRSSSRNTRTRSTRKRQGDHPSSSRAREELMKRFLRSASCSSLLSPPLRERQPRGGPSPEQTRPGRGRAAAPGSPAGQGPARRRSDRAKGGTSTATRRPRTTSSRRTWRSTRRASGDSRTGPLSRRKAREVRILGQAALRLRGPLRRRHPDRLEWRHRPPALSGKVEFQACNDKQCLAPASVAFRSEAGPVAAAAAGAPAPLVRWRRAAL